MDIINLLKEYLWLDWGKPCNIEDLFKGDYEFIELHEPNLIAVVHICEKTASTFIYRYENNKFIVVDKYW